MEGSYAPRDELQNLAGLGVEWLFIGHGQREMEWSKHCNSEIVRWTLHEHGVTLAGPVPEGLVDPVIPEALRAKMREVAPRFLDDLLTWIGLVGAWAVRYAVTTLCRVLFTLEAGTVASKRTALRWAKESLGPEWRELVTQAPARSRRHRPGRWPPSSTCRTARAGSAVEAARAGWATAPSRAQ